MAAGSIIIDLLMRTGSFETDTRRAAANWNRFTGAVTSTAVTLGAAAAAGGVAAAGMAAAWGASMTRTANEVQRFSQLSNASTTEFQRWAAATATVGIEQDKLSGIFKDVNGKVGEFVSTGGGPLKDFFTEIAPKVGVTADQFKKLSGPEALGLYYSSLEKAGLSQQQMTFYMEALASDATGLIPLLQNNSAELNRLGDAAATAGQLMSSQAIVAAKELSDRVNSLTTTAGGFSTAIANDTLPILNEFTKSLWEGGDGTGGLKQSIDEFTKDSSFHEWIKEALVMLAKFVDVAAVSVNAITLVGASFKSAYNDVKVGLLWMNTVSPAAGQTQEQADLSYQNALADREKGLKNFDKQYSDFVNYDHNVEKRMNRAIASSGAGNASNNDHYDRLKTSSKLENELKSNTATVKTATAAHKKTQEAMNSLSHGEQRALQTVMGHANKYDYSSLEKSYGLPKNILAALEMQESRGKVGARSPVGASGAFQFMPGTAKNFGVDVTDVGSSAKGAAKYLSMLLKRYQGNVELAINAYNWGEGNVDKLVSGKKSKKPKETQGHWTGVSKYQKAIGGDTFAPVETDADRALQAQQQYIKSIQEQMSLLGAQTEQEKVLANLQQDKYKNLSAAQKQAMIDSAKEIDGAGEKLKLEERYKTLIEDITHAGAIKSHFEDLSLIKKAWEEGQISLEQYTLAKAEMEKNAPVSNAAPIAELSAFDQWIKGANEASFNMDQAGTNMLDGMTDSLATFVTTGKLSFSDFASSVVKDLARIAAQKAIAGIFSSLFGSVAGGASGSAIDFSGGSFSGVASGFASGGFTGFGGKYEAAGIVHKGEVVFSQDDVKRFGGVSRVEAMRLRGYSNGGVVGGGVAMSSGSGVTVGDINVTVESGKKGMDSDKGKQLGQMVRASVLEVIMEQRRQGGILA